MKYLILILTAICLTQFTFSQDVSNDTPEEVYSIVEKIPSFQGGETALLKHLQENIQYPAEAAKSGIGDKIFVEFIVDATGKVKNPTIKRSLGTLLDEEAIRVISNMPLWKPATQGGKNVAVRYTLPIMFRAD